MVAASAAVINPWAQRGMVLFHPPFFFINFMNTMMKFKYNKKIDQKCWKRIIKVGKMFGHRFPDSFNVTKRDIIRAKKQVKYFQRIWEKNEKVFYEIIKKIYGYPFPKKMICYINTSPYSMDDLKKNYISVSMYRNTQKKIISTIIHEASHFMFRKYYTSFCRRIGCSQDNIEQIKEIITVINNVEFNNVNDYGWKIHQKMRKKLKKYGGKLTVLKK